MYRYKYIIRVQVDMKTWYLIAVVIRYETPEDALHLSGRDCKREWLGLTGLQSSGFVTSDGLESSSQVVIVLLASLLCVAHD